MIVHAWHPLKNRGQKKKKRKELEEEENLQERKTSF